MEDFGPVLPDSDRVHPYGYQARMARRGCPRWCRRRPGAARRESILAWLWRRLYGPDPAATPRRLVYALPQRSLVEQVGGEAAAVAGRTWGWPIRSRCMW